MKSIRRSVGAFTCAALVAASVVLAPARAHAEQASFCEALILTIEQVRALPDSLFKALLLQQLDGTYKTFCPQG